MGFTSAIKKILGLHGAETDSNNYDDTFAIQADSSSVFFLNDPGTLADLTRLAGSDQARLQHVALEMLLEQNAVSKVARGYRMLAETAVRLDPESAADLGLPAWFDGKFDTELTGNTPSPRFNINLVASKDRIALSVERKGPFFMFGSKQYRLTPQSFEILQAIEDHRNRDLKNQPAAEVETANLELVAKVNNAGATAFDADEPRFTPNMRHLEHFRALIAETVTVDVEPQEDGSLRLSPNLGHGLNPDDVDQRWHQIPDDAEEGVLRIGNDLVAVKKKQLDGARAILRRSHVPKSDREAFFSAPAEYLESDNIDFDVTFGVRVKGMGVSASVEYDDFESSGIDWIQDVEAILTPDELPKLLKTHEEIDDFAEVVENAWSSEGSVVPLNNALVDISDRLSIQTALEEARQQIPPERPGGLVGASKAHIGMVISDESQTTSSIHDALLSVPRPEPELSNLRRKPFPHQSEGIQWLLKLFTAAESTKASAEPIQGGILADDMGLGKTFMTLVALEQFFAQIEADNSEPGPVLAVLPLSLIESWEREIEKTFTTSPFSDVVVLHSNRDLARFRKPHLGPETSTAVDNLDADGMVDISKLNCSLRFGEHYGEARLDRPARLVLTTYAGLTNYQLSLSQIYWSVVVFDEAQTMKNPKTLVSRAAKGLQATFKLLATGTPVENELKDMWNLCDIAQPGLLGTWPEFRSLWVPKKNSSEEETSLDGVALRSKIGEFMLRRTKEDHLPGLPSKTIHSGIAGDEGTHYDARMATEMPEPQRIAYDTVLARHKGRGKSGALDTLHGLRSVSLHPDLLADRSASQFDPKLSGRLIAALEVVDSVQRADEKVVIFVISKSMQIRLRMWLENRYGFPVTIVNGETASTSTANSMSRQAHIDGFQSVQGFNIIIMSPLAAGTGLTLTGANHVIHLERHWNPAKEAQATDRVYRIGQDKPVHIYLPIAEHPDPNVTAFDRNLNRLLNQKSDLKDSVVIPIDAKKSMIASLNL